eukprot:scaffold78424_cov39-Cyclotella_meneghiniana.AAC.2
MKALTAESMTEPTAAPNGFSVQVGTGSALVEVADGGSHNRRKSPSTPTPKQSSSRPSKKSKDGRSSNKSKAGDSVSVKKNDNVANDHDDEGQAESKAGDSGGKIEGDGVNVQSDESEYCPRASCTLLPRAGRHRNLEFSALVAHTFIATLGNMDATVDGS